MNRLLGAWYTLLRNFDNQKGTADYTDLGTQETEYDDRQSMLPFVKEKQCFESFAHQGKIDKHEDDSTHQRKLVDWTRRLAYTTGALAIATFIVACFSGWQAWEMRSGADQQHRDTLAALAKTDATIAAMQGQAEIMRGQLRVMEIDKRPWVAIDAAIPDTFRAIHADDQNAAMSLTVDFILSNTGEAPAVYVRTWPTLVITGPPGDPLHYSKLLCDQLRTQPITENTATYTIFPGKILPPLRNSFQTSRRSVEATRNAANGEILGLVVAGCVDYGFVGRPEHHQTGFAFEVSRKAPTIPGGQCCAIDFSGNDVPAADLRITLYPFGGFYAD
jgi:hypothetical protein